MSAAINERIRASIPTRELERRWAEVRKAMKAQDIDTLIMQNDNMYLGGYVRYFLDFPAVNGYPVTVIFPKDDEMTTITHGGPPRPPRPPAWALRGVKTRLSFPYFRTAYWTNSWDAEATVKIIKDRGDKRVGIVGLGCMHAAYYKYLEENLSGVELVEVTDLVDRIKAVKSADEMVFVRLAAETQDMVMAAVPTVVRPGKYEYEVRTELEWMLGDLGSEEQLMKLGSAPIGTPAGTQPNHFMNHRIEWGDQVAIMIEPSGPGGYYGELNRTFVLGEPPENLVKSWADARSAQHYVAGICTPGAKPAEIFKKYNEYLTDKGYPLEGRIFAHGQGYDLVERPLIRDGEDMELEAGMVLAIHPLLLTDHSWAFCCDDFLVTDTGGERLHRTPQEIIMIRY